MMKMKQTRFKNGGELTELDDGTYMLQNVPLENSHLTLSCYFLKNIEHVAIDWKKALKGDKHDLR